MMPAGGQKGLEAVAGGAAPPRDTMPRIPPPIPKAVWPPTGQAMPAKSSSAVPVLPLPGAAVAAPAGVATQGGVTNASGSGVAVNGMVPPRNSPPSAGQGITGTPGETGVPAAAAAAAAPAAPSAASFSSNSNTNINSKGGGDKGGGGAAAAAAAVVGPSATAAAAAGRKDGKQEEPSGSRKRERSLTPLESKKRAREMQLKDFLLAVKEYGSTVPGEATRFHLQRGGLATSNNQIVTLMSLAADHLVANIVHESALFRNLRLQRPGERAREDGELGYEDGQMLTNEDLSMSLGTRGIYVSDSGSLVKRAGAAAVAAAAAADAKEDGVG